MRVGVSGSRDYDRWRVVHRVLDKFHTRYGIDAIIQGEGSGADFCARTWAANRHVPLAVDPLDQQPYRAEWEKYGNRAGPIRNERMAESSEADLWLTFPGGRGTQHMQDMCRKFEIPCLHHPDTPWERGHEKRLNTVRFDREGRRVEKPFWIVEPVRRFKIVDPAIRAARSVDLEAAAKRYESEALF